MTRGLENRVLRELISLPREELCRRLGRPANPRRSSVRNKVQTGGNAQNCGIAVLPDADNWIHQLLTQRFSRLGSSPDRLIESQQPSPGEIRKRLLALGIARVLHLILMDVPTTILTIDPLKRWNLLGLTADADFVR